MWTWHLGAGVVILVLLGLHMTIMHLDAIVGVFNPHGGQPDRLGERGRAGQERVLHGDLHLLLGAALFHGLYGLRNILFELNPAPAPRRR